ncbi:DUF2510 domain-containing protein [Herbiconiux sp. CPCC 203407]|uniref:DUF2510 domain-containing protein n=1 Tax=Herbiconiux oxytropis TaxID=2970915 RepID=A0AA41XFN3_9MICO|nr:DUF2510 domain-containing protein [Herbiconiux oxytropis]MCS5722220.1 DUF2510 domain-containing protein [Herbiconiux oxytropis]MCS5727142.1 DUF2510 domain-containing protein [Herbiconiux oxytropis]
MSTADGRTPAGWYPDPAGSAFQRWWDGTAWTGHLQQASASQPTAAAPPAYPAQPDHYAYSAQQSAPATPPKVAPGTPAYGPFIWVITLLPLIGLLTLPLSFTDLEQQLSVPYSTDPSSVDPFAGMSTAALVAQAVAAVVGWAIYGAGVVLAFFDRKWLLARGYAQPFHWAFAFLGVVAPVYAIGRSLVVRRRSGRGIAPMWVAFGIVALSFVITIVVIVYVVDLTLRSMGAMPGITA